LYNGYASDTDTFQLTLDESQGTAKVVGKSGTVFTYKAKFTDTEVTWYEPFPSGSGGENNVFNRMTGGYTSYYHLDPRYPEGSPLYPPYKCEAARKVY
jgi:hypothetical protein